MGYMEMKRDELAALCGERGIAFPSKATKAKLAELLEAGDLSSPIEVEAVEVDDQIIPANALSVDVEGMKRAAVALTEAMDSAATALGEYDVDDAAIDAMAVSDIRICEDGIAAALKDVDERRKELTRLLTTPKKAIDGKVKELTEPLKALGERYADARQAVYYRGYAAQYSECCIANGVEELERAVPFERFVAGHARWLSRTANPVKVQERIAEEVARVAADWERLRGFKDSMRFYDVAEREFFETLDVNAALAAQEKAARQQERVDALNREREENERWMAEQAARAQAAQERPQAAVDYGDAPEPAPVAERPAEPARAPQGRADGRRRYHFEAWMTDAEIASFREWKNACGVGEGWTFREVRNG